LTCPPHPNDSQPDKAKVISIDAWRNVRSAQTGRQIRRSRVDIDEGTDSGAIPGSDQWWNRALKAFKAYIELAALESHAPEEQKTSGNSALE
jgi:hypothetical protein